MSLRPTKKNNRQQKKNGIRSQNKEKVQTYG